MIDKYIDNAQNGVSSLTDDILNLEGMSSFAIRHLLNNIMSQPNINYLEIGVYRGSTFISALYKNEVNATAIDNWSFWGDGTKDVFLNNCAKFNIRGFNLIEQDSFSLDLSQIKDKVNVYFYDGDHTTDSTVKSLSYYYPVLADEFLYIVDDLNWDFVSVGVYDGIRECNFDVKGKWELMSNFTGDKDTWWNGIGLYQLKKK